MLPRRTRAVHRSLALISVAGLLAACDLPYAAPPTCPDGTVLNGNQCAPGNELAEADPRSLPQPDAGFDAGGAPTSDGGPPVEDSGTPPVDAGGTPGTDGGAPGVDGGVPPIDAGFDPDDVTLPFFIEEHYIMSGFFSETGSAAAERLDCSAVSGTQAGATCIRVRFTPNGDTFGGFFFQYPENNFGTAPGLPIQPGAQQVRFRAWGDTGGERVKFGAGIDNDNAYSDDFNVEVALTLTTTPTEYFVDLRNITYDLVAGGFVWVAETPTGTGNVTFSMDNIEWTADAPVDTGVPLPFWVDDHYAMSGFFPGPPASAQIVESCGAFAGTDPGSMCRRITITPNGQTFAGFFFQFPENNFGAQPGKLIAQGATEITFRAWGATGAEVVSFGAGLDNDLPNEDGWNVETTPAALPTTPTAYSIDISGIDYDRVGGAFLWVLQLPDGVTPRTFYLDNVRWQ